MLQKPKRFEPLEKIVMWVNERGETELGDTAFADSRGIYIARDNATNELVVIKFPNKGMGEADTIERLVDVPQVPVLVHKGSDYYAMSMMPGSALLVPASHNYSPEKFVLAAAQLFDFIVSMREKRLSYYDFRDPNFLFDDERDSLSVVDFSNLSTDIFSERSLLQDYHYFLNLLFYRGERLEDSDYRSIKLPEGYNILGDEGKFSDILLRMEPNQALEKLKDFVTAVAINKGMAEHDAKHSLWNKADGIIRQRSYDKGNYVRKLGSIDPSQYDNTIDVSGVKKVRGVTVMLSEEGLAERVASRERATVNKENNPEERARWQRSLDSQLGILERGYIYLEGDKLPSNAPSWYVGQLRDAVYQHIKQRFSDPKTAFDNRISFEKIVDALHYFNMEPKSVVDNLFEVFSQTANKWYTENRESAGQRFAPEALQKVTLAEIADLGKEVNRLHYETNKVVRTYMDALRLTQHPALAKVQIDSILGLPRGAFQEYNRALASKI